MKQTKLIGARARKNWTLEQAAERIGCTPNTLNRWELGKFSPSAFYRARLSEVYGVPWEVLDLGSDATGYNAIALSPFTELETVDIIRSRREILQ